jgi:hypothetical protein
MNCRIDLGNLKIQEQCLLQGSISIGTYYSTTVNFIFVTISPIGLVCKNYSAGAKLLTMVAAEFFLPKMDTDP